MPSAISVTVPPLSVRIARCRFVRRDNSASDVGLDGASDVGPVGNGKVPRCVILPPQVLVEPRGLPGVYVARVVATLCDE
jgi:hypothetical protein